MIHIAEHKNREFLVLKQPVSQLDCFRKRVEASQTPEIAIFAAVNYRGFVLCFTLRCKSCNQFLHERKLFSMSGIV